MVKTPTAKLDLVFHAIADPTRRALLERLGRSPGTVSQLAEPFSVSLVAVAKHLKVLERAGLVVKKRCGKAVECRIDLGPLAEADSWIERQRAYWSEQLDGLGRHLDAQAAPVPLRSAEERKRDS